MNARVQSCWECVKVNNIDVSNACCRSTIAIGDQNAMISVGPAPAGGGSRFSFCRGRGAQRR